MGRVDTFRQARRDKHKYILAFFMIILFLTAGFYTVDRSLNDLITGQPIISIVSFKNTNNSNLDIEVMGYKIAVNITYIYKDYKKILDWAGNCLSMPWESQ